MTSSAYHEICEWLRQLIEGTQWEGHVYAVGGCCRDEIMGFDIQDVDLAVDLPMGGVKFARWLEKRRLTVGRPVFFVKYGTAKLVLRRFPDEEIELVQTRKEQYTKETSRCPEVAFGSIEEDCFRRDFTVNSLYYDITARRMVDITGKGIPDMKAGLLRTPMDPDETFNEDPVRILRCLRFANRFGWTVDPPVMQALLRHIYRLAIVSRERRQSELCKMLNGPDPVGMMATLRDCGALAVIVPQFELLGEGAWQCALARLGRICGAPGSAPTRMRLASLMLELGSTAARSGRLARDVMDQLRFVRPVSADVSFMVEYASIDPSDLDNPRRVRALQNKASRPRRLELLVEFMAALGRTQEAAAVRRLSDAVVESGFHGFSDEQDIKPGKRRGSRRAETPAGSGGGKRRRGGKRRNRRRRNRKDNGGGVGEAQSAAADGSGA